MRPTTAWVMAALLGTSPVFAQPINRSMPPAFPADVAATANALPGTAASGSPPASATGQSSTPIAHAPLEQLLPFDAAAAEVRWVDNQWQLLAGGVWLKDFRHEADAREALRIIRDMGLNQRGTVGTPRPIMEYWLANGQAPQGRTFGLHLVPLELNSLRVEQVQGQWLIRDARRLFFVFGSHEDQARRALDLIRDHGFTEVGFVGQPVPAFMYFIGGPGGFGQGRMASPAPIASRRQPAPPGYPTQPNTGTLPPETLNAAALLNPGAGTSPLEVQRARQLATVVAMANDRPAFGDRVSFDPYQLKAQKDGQDWKVVFGDFTLANFGPSAADAQRALHVLQYYRCTEQCLVGQPEPSFSFFLSNGQAPRGTMFGLSGTSFRPQALVIRQTPGGWAICERDQPLIHCRNNVDDARRLLQIMQQQQFNLLCRIGPEPYGMTILLRTH